MDKKVNVAPPKEVEIKETPQRESEDEKRRQAGDAAENDESEVKREKQESS